MISLKATPQAEQEWSLVDKFFNDLAKPKHSTLRPVTDVIRRGFLENFMREQSGDGTAWEELAPATVDEREAEGYGGTGPIQVRSGSYEDSFTSASGLNHIEEIITSPKGYTIDVGTADSRADLLEQGGFTNFNGVLVYVPARPVTILGDRQESDIGNALDAFFLSLG